MHYFQIWENYKGTDTLTYDKIADMKKCYEIIGEFKGRKKYTIKKVIVTDIMSVNGKEAKAMFEKVSNPPEATAYPC